MGGPLRVVAASLALVLAQLLLPVVHAAQVCDAQPCNIQFDFADGGSIVSSQGATITFGSGGALALGEGGSITPGDGGAITPAPAEAQPPDMSAGGTVILGPGGSIQFGIGGFLGTGDEGGISVTAESSFDVQSARSVVVSSDGSVFLGGLSTHGSIDMTAAGDMSDGDATTSSNLGMTIDDPDTSITVTSGGDVRWREINGDPQSITLHAGGSIVFTDDGAHAPGGGTSSPSSNCGAPGSNNSAVVYTNNGSYSSWDSSCSVQIDDPGVLDGGIITVTPVRKGSGALPQWSLVVLAGLGLARRRQPRKEK